jgi:peptidoglycan/LPS O-acetylase OafA/YrhL
VKHQVGPYPSLDAFRGLGMLMVTSIHVSFSSGFFSRHPLVGDFISRLEVALPIFFVMSGFLLSRPYFNAILEDRTLPSLSRYVRNRAFRILPAYWVALAVILIWFGIPKISGVGWLDHPPFGPIIVFATMLQTFVAGAVFGGYSAFDQVWSLGTEVTFYALLPLLALWLRRGAVGRDVAQRVRLITTVLVGLMVFAQLWRTGLWAVAPGWKRSAMFWLPSHVDYFASGMLLSLWSIRERRGAALPPVVKLLADRPWLSWLGAGAAYLVAVNPGHLLPVLRVSRSPLEFGADYLARQFLYLIIATLMVLPAMLGPRLVGAGRKLLASAPLAWLGTISLGGFLWHKAWLEQIQHWLGYGPFQGDMLRLSVLTLLAACIVGTLSYLLVERPLMNVAQRLGERADRDRVPR